MAKRQTSKVYENGLHAEWSNVNQAWFLMWYDTPLRILTTLKACDKIAATWMKE